MVVVDLNKPAEDDESSILIMLYKDQKVISQVSCPNSPVKIPEHLHIKDITPAAYHPLSNLPKVYFHAAGQTRFQLNEWETFLTYLVKRDKVAVCQHELYEFLITPPVGQDPANCHRVTVAYRPRKFSRGVEFFDCSVSAGHRNKESMPVRVDAGLKPQTPTFHTTQLQGVAKDEDSRRTRIITEDVSIWPQNSQSLQTKPVNCDVTSVISRAYQEDSMLSEKEQGSYETAISFPRAAVNVTRHMHYPSAQMNQEAPQSSSREVRRERPCTERGRPRHGLQHPEYLNTLRHSHSEWVFGALAELIDNSRDANSARLDISIQMEYYPRAGKKIPLLSVIDNGCGMSHLDIIRMMSLGHARPTEDNRDYIGRFGVGFKTGSMQLGKDVVVLTQCERTRSIALLSRSYNENKQEVDIPIITYKREGGWMDFDLQVHSKSEAEEQLQAIKEYSPFNEYAIGNKFALFGENGTGTQIYIYNLSLWGSGYTLEWDERSDEERTPKKKRDIWIRSRRVRTRQGQISQEVPLDYSLHAYLELIFLNPRMKIYVQGTMVRTRPLAKSLNKTKILKDVLMGKNIELTLGRSQEERERGNCGIFLYWHGRLIEAYKRVGGMVQSADMGRGVIGVIDVTEIMKDGNGEIMVLNTKQGFQDCEAYALLDQWLASKTDEYWDENFDTLELRDNSKGYKPDHQWVQCNKCLKWRILDPNFNSENLPAEWFCFMSPFKGLCNMPEQKVEPGVITVSAKRTFSSVSNGGPLRSMKEERNVTPVDDSVVTTSSTRGESEILEESEEEIKPAVAKHFLKQGCDFNNLIATKKQGESPTSSDSEDEIVVELQAMKQPLKRLRRGPPPPPLRTSIPKKGKKTTRGS